MRGRTLRMAVVRRDMASRLRSRSAPFRDRSILRQPLLVLIFVFFHPQVATHNPNVLVLKVIPGTDLQAISRVRNGRTRDSFLTVISFSHRKLLPTSFLDQREVCVLKLSQSSVLTSEKNLTASDVS
jgi:hypothetical protein